MHVDWVLAKLTEIDRVVGSVSPARVRALVIDAEDALQEMHREMMRLMRELEMAKSRQPALPTWKETGERLSPNGPRSFQQNPSADRDRFAPPLAEEKSRD